MSLNMRPYSGPFDVPSPTISAPTRVSLSQGGGGGSHPDFWQTHRPTKVPPPRGGGGGGGYWTLTHPPTHPTTKGKMPYHRQNALTPASKVPHNGLPYRGGQLDTHPPTHPELLTPPLCNIPSGCCSFTGPWTVTRSSLRMLRQLLLSVGRCGRCSCWCRFHVRGAQ